jgi:hypothetical protein
LGILFVLHLYTNWPEGLKGTQFIWQKSSSEMSWKTKRKCTCRAVWAPTNLSLFHRWIMLILGYVVRLDIAFILDGWDRKLILRQGFVHVNSSLSIFREARFYADLGRSNHWSIMILRYSMHNSMICSLTIGFKVIIRNWWLIGLWIYC